jgi:Ca-activated chloride channel family protein
MCSIIIILFFSFCLNIVSVLRLSNNRLSLRALTLVRPQSETHVRKGHKNNMPFSIRICRFPFLVVAIPVSKGNTSISAQICYGGYTSFWYKKREYFSNSGVFHMRRHKFFICILKEVWMMRNRMTLLVVVLIAVVSFLFSLRLGTSEKANASDAGRNSITTLEILQDTSRSERPPVLTEAPEEPTEGSLVTVDAEGKKIEVPLEHTDVQADISGFIARVDVSQKFVNPFDKRIEAIYVFPLPQDAAVDRMVMKIGDRTIKGVIKKREEARAIYERARAEGKTASLLEQERPNIFTQSVANILPGDTILVNISYVEVMEYEKGEYEFVFPMVVGPRYIPGAPLPKNPSGTGWSPDTDKVPDASRITPPVLPPGMRTGHDISVTVHLDAGVPVQEITCTSHPVVLDTLSQSEMTITLAKKDVIPNKDFILNYNVLGEELEMALLSHRVEDVGYFLLIIQPKMVFTDSDITPKEMVFVVDNSGSMRGEPIGKAKEAMRHCIRNMNVDDTFQIIKFSEAASSFSPHPLSNTSANRQQGLHFINEMHGSGGTRMIEGIKAALGFTPDLEKLRTVLFMTDGYIGNESEILTEIQNLLGTSRLFSFGVGSSVNRYLLERMAEVGRGAVQYVSLDENTDEAVGTFYDRIAKPYLTDISIDWGRAGIRDTYPSRIPDLFSAQPVVVLGRYEKSGVFEIEVEGSIRNTTVVFPLIVELPEHDPEHDVIKSLWARHKIKDLTLRDIHLSEEIEEMITNTALEFNLISQYTAFVAVEEQVRVDEIGNPVVVNVPVPMPDGVSYEGVFGGSQPAKRFASGSESMNMKMGGRVSYMMSIEEAPSPGITEDLFIHARTDEGRASPEGGYLAIQNSLVYPEDELIAGIEGTVTVQVRIDKNGDAGGTKIVGSLHPNLDKAAIAAVKSVRWKPAMKNGHPFESQVSVPVRFEIAEKWEERRIGGKVFVHRGKFWVENTYQGEKMNGIRYDSRRFKEFVGDTEGLRFFFDALGPNVVLQWKGIWYKVSEGIR